MEKKKEERKRSRSWCNDTRTHTHTSLPNITFLLPHPLLAVPRSFALIIIVFTPSFAIGFHRHPRQERSKYDNMQNFFKQTILWWESKQIDSKNHARKAKQTLFFSPLRFQLLMKETTTNRLFLSLFSSLTDLVAFALYQWSVSSIFFEIDGEHLLNDKKKTKPFWYHWTTVMFLFFLLPNRIFLVHTWRTIDQFGIAKKGKQTLFD